MYTIDDIARRIDRITKMVRIFSDLRLDLNWEKSRETVIRFSEWVVFHRYKAMNPRLSIRINCERRTGTSCIPHGVKLRSKPSTETRAIEKPKLNPILSNLFIPLNSCFIGKSMKISRYPGMKSRKGNPIIMRNISFMSSKTIGSNMILHRRNRIMSIGYFLNWYIMILT
jgi:hypothetical protein